MTKQKSTKKALLTSVLSLVICMSMLIGTTFAWFTDSVTSANNRIVAGNLEVDLLMWDGSDYKSIADGKGDIFTTGTNANNSSATLWEPGKTQVAYLAIENAGTLDLKYTVALDVKNVSKNLYEVMEYTITPDAKDGTGVTSWDANKGKPVEVGTQSVSGDVSLKAGKTHYFALSIHMDEDADNDYQGGEVSFDLTVLATQLNSEADSFNSDYDKLATYPVTNTTELKQALEEGGTYTLNKGTYDLSGETLTIADGTTIVGNDAELVLDLSAKASGLKIGNDVTITGVSFEGNEDGDMDIAYPLNITGDNVVIEGCEFDYTSSNYYTIKIDSNAENVVIKDCNFVGGMRQIGDSYGATGSTVTIENCTFTGAAYAIHFDGVYADVLVKDCEIEGMCAIASSGNGTFKMSGCSFSDAGDYHRFNLYRNITLEDCELEQSYWFAPGKADLVITVNNCTWENWGTGKNAVENDTYGTSFYLVENGVKYQVVTSGGTTTATIVQE